MHVYKCSIICYYIYQHVPVTPVTIIRGSYQNKAISIKIIVQKYMPTFLLKYNRIRFLYVVWWMCVWFTPFWRGEVVHSRKVGKIA